MCSKIILIVCQIDVLIPYVKSITAILSADISFSNTTVIVRCFQIAKFLLPYVRVPPLTLRPYAGQGLIILEVYGSHTTTHHSL